MSLLSQLIVQPSIHDVDSVAVASSNSAKVGIGCPLSRAAAVVRIGTFFAQILGGAMQSSANRVIHINRIEKGEQYFGSLVCNRSSLSKDCEKGMSESKTYVPACFAAMYGTTRASNTCLASRYATRSVRSFILFSRNRSVVLGCSVVSNTMCWLT